MKKLLVLAAMITLAAPVGFAGKSSGCGLGSNLLAGQSGMVMNVLAITLNGFSSNSTFGVTMGTSGCDSSDTVYNQTQQQEFVAANMDVLAEEMAQGNGQTVAALAELMGCNGAQVDFARLSQAKYETLFSAPEADASAWLGGLKQELSRDVVLSSNCTRIS